MIQRSIGEIAALAKKATRGAGYPWGICEDAAAATAWLVGHGLPGVPCLSQVLASKIILPIADAMPVTTNDPWASADGSPLCPLLTGVTLSDHISLPRYKGKITVAGLRSPLLTAACIASFGQANGHGHRLEWAGVVIEASEGRAWVQANPEALLFENAEWFTCRQIDAPRSNEGIPPSGHPHIEPQAWAHLETLAARTFAPATEVSRLKGAGDGPATA